MVLPPAMISPKSIIPCVLRTVISTLAKGKIFGKQLLHFKKDWFIT